MGPADACSASTDVLISYPVSSLGFTKNSIVHVLSNVPTSAYDPLDNGKAYIQFNTQEYPQGVVRGQLLPPSYFSSSNADSFPDKTCQKPANVTTSPSPTRMGNLAAQTTISFMAVICITYLFVLLNL